MFMQMFIYLSKSLWKCYVTNITIYYIYIYKIEKFINIFSKNLLYLFFKYF